MTRISSAARDLRLMYRPYRKLLKREVFQKYHLASKGGHVSRHHLHGVPNFSGLTRRLIFWRYIGAKFVELLEYSKLRLLGRVELLGLWHMGVDVLGGSSHQVSHLTSIKGYTTGKQP